MNKTGFFAAAALAVLAAVVFSCADRNPLYPAVEQAVIDSNPTLQSFYVTSLKLESSVTLDDELNRRQSLFAGKEKTYAKAAEKYKRQNMPNNYAKNEEERQKAAATLERIDEYRKDHEAQLDSIIYYVYRMSGYGYAADKTKFQANNNYVSVTPENKVLSIQPADGNPYTGMGVTIPDYHKKVVRGTVSKDGN